MSPTGSDRFEMGQTPSGFPGFTLLELAVAAALGVMLLTAVAVLGARGMAAWRSVDSRLQVLFHLEKGLSRMAEELRNGAAPADLPFHGSADEIAFATAVQATRLTEVQYRVVPGGSGGSAWVRQWRPFPAGESESGQLQTETLVAGVTRFALQYGTVAAGEGQKVLRWVENWDDLEQELKTIPRIVRVRLQGADARGRVFAVTRDLWIPQGRWVSAPNE